jgi:uncharacterized SAM-binding protein YcdF (DUF218 family)
MTFLLKKIASRFLFPLPLSLEILLVGVILLWFTRRQRAGKLCVTVGVILLILFSSGVISDPLLARLEHRYPPLTLGQSGSEVPAIHYIVVLGGGANHDPDVPLTSHIAPALMVRLIEGVWLHRQIAGSKLILSGPQDSAEGMTEMAEALGVNPDDTLRLAQPHDTAEESRQIAPIVGSESFILVTSAAHMPRAMALFRKRGMRPIPAPTDYLTIRHELTFDDFFPDAYKLNRTQEAFYEWLGLGWESLRGNM